MILYEMLTGKLLFKNVNVPLKRLRPSKNLRTNGISTKTAKEECNTTPICILIGSFSPTTCSLTIPRSDPLSTMYWRS